jgi:TetR/AcrR family transcriptional regulator, transcriptional repressor for nem operon
MPNCSEAILDAAERRIRTHGYNGFSFRDVASDVGIKSASVHYHFATKPALAASVARRYRLRFAEAVAAEELSGADRITAWRRVFRRALEHDGLMCLCGVLASGGAALPEAVTRESRQFFEEGAAALASATGGGPQAAAIMAQLEGAMLVAQAFGDIAMFDVATATLGQPQPA